MKYPKPGLQKNLIIKNKGRSKTFQNNLNDEMLIKSYPPNMGNKFDNTEKRKTILL